MKKRLRDHFNVQKITRGAIVLNAMQIIAIAVIFLYVLFNRTLLLSHNTEVLILGLCLFIVVWGAAMDIRDAILTRRIAEQTRMVEEAYAQLEELNGTLRSQRHDFMNHLQVVFSLTELQEYDEAKQYIERVYGDILKVGRVLKTSIPAVNALIAAKSSDCGQEGILFETKIASAWSGLPVPGWEMCRIFGNLIDNARDALLSREGALPRRINISLAESPGAYTFSVSNNGPKIPESHLMTIFQQGFTTKSGGHGSGLAIVKELIEQYDGKISVTSDDSETIFTGTIPKPAPAHLQNR